MSKFLSTLSLRRATGPTGRINVRIRRFLSTLSLRRATILPPVDTSSVRISIHALLAESDCRLWVEQQCRKCISIHALLAESDPYFHVQQTVRSLFLSTLSLRRATRESPWGWCIYQISIHALLAESDCLLLSRGISQPPFLSTLSLRRATVVSVQIGGNV